MDPELSVMLSTIIRSVIARLVLREIRLFIVLQSKKVHKSLKFEVTIV